MKSPSILEKFNVKPCKNASCMCFQLTRNVRFKGRTIRKVMGGGGGGRGEFSACTNFFFLLTACAGIFFSGETLCTNFFFRQILLFSQ